MKKKYQVFISSTYKDLKKERFEVMQTLLKFGCMPAGMELFPATNDSQWNFIKKVIDESDYYIIIVGGKYGSVHPEKGISYTKMEYDYAEEIGKPILRYLVKDLNKLSQGNIEKDSKLEKKLLDFRKHLMKDNLCTLYESPKDLALQVYHGINQLIESQPSSGWIRFSDFLPKNQITKEKDVVTFDDLKSIKEKIVFYKLLNLKSIKNNPPSIYEKFIPRLNKTIKISSEYMTFKVVKFDGLVSNFKGRDRTNGDAIELKSFYPFIRNLEDGDKWATLIEPVITGPTDVLVSSGNVYNGFKQGDLDFGVKAEKDIEIVRLFVDISSIPNFSKILPKQPKLFYNKFVLDIENNSENLQDLLIDKYEILAPGIFLIEIKKMKKDEAMRFEFSIDIDTMSNFS